MSENAYESFCRYAALMIERYELHEWQWQLIRDLFPSPKATGRKRRDPRQMLNAICWILCSGASWRDLPEHYLAKVPEMSASSGLFEVSLPKDYKKGVERGPLLRLLSSLLVMRLGQRFESARRLFRISLDKPNAQNRREVRSLATRFPTKLPAYVRLVERAW